MAFKCQTLGLNPHTEWNWVFNTSIISSLKRQRGRIRNQGSLLLKLKACLGYIRLHVRKKGRKGMGKDFSTLLDFIVRLLTGRK